MSPRNERRWGLAGFGLNAKGQGVRCQWSGPKAGTRLRYRYLDSGYGNRRQPDDLKERRSPSRMWGRGPGAWHVTLDSPVKS